MSRIKTSIVFNLTLANNTILLFLPLFLDNWLILLNSCSDCTYLHPTQEMVIPTGMPANEAKAEVRTQPLTAEIKRAKCTK